jgi:hypothetical protein
MTISTAKPKIIFTRQPAYGGIVNGFFGAGIAKSMGGPGGRDPIGAVDAVPAGGFDGLTAGCAGVGPFGGTGAPGGVSGGLESSLMGRVGADNVHRSLSNVHWEFRQ